MKRPSDTVDIAANVDKQRLGCQPLDGALEDVTDADVRDFEECLLEDRGLEREPDKPIDERSTDDAGLVRRPWREGAGCCGERWRVRV